MKPSEAEATTLDDSQSTQVVSSPRQKPWPWLLLALILVAGGGGFAAWRLRGGGGASPQQAAQAQQAIPVQLEQLESSTLEDSSQFVGALEAAQGIVLRPKVEGRVTQLYVSAGDTVAPGDPILELSADRSQAEVSAALANVSAARAARNTALAQLRAVEAERGRAAADLELQNQEYNRTQFLVSEGAQTQQQLDVVERDRAAARATVNAAEEQIRAAQASVAEANASLEQAEAQVNASRADLEDTLVTAPIAGIVGDLVAKLGDYVSAGDELTTITQNQTLELELAVPIEYRDQLRTGLPVQLRRFESENSDEPLVTGRISFVSPQVNADTQSVLAKASFPNPRGLLQDAQRVEARVIWREQPGVLVPATAVSRLGGQTFIYVARQPESAPPEGPQWVAEQRLVQLGNMQGNNYQVIEGVQPGETIVVSGILNLSDGAPIVPQDESAPPNGTPPMAP